MNENEKKYIYIIVALFVVFAMFLWGSFRGIATRDYELKRTRTELFEATDRLRSANERAERLEAGLASVEDGFGNIHKVLAENNGGLHAAIERLQVIATEVERLENRVHNLRNNNGGGGSSVDMEPE